MTRYQFLMNTVNYYGEDITRRAQKEHSYQCQYRFYDKKCAVGREIPDHKYKPEMEAGWSLDKVMKEGAPHLIPLGEPFVSQIQNLHDIRSNWGNETGLSTQGEERFCQIVNTYLL